MNSMHRSSVGEEPKDTKKGKTYQREQETTENDKCVQERERGAEAPGEKRGREAVVREQDRVSSRNTPSFQTS